MRAFEENIRKVVPYVPGEQPKRARMIKLNTNENPYPPGSRRGGCPAGLPADSLRRYSDPACNVLTEAIADVYG